MAKSSIFIEGQWVDAERNEVSICPSNGMPVGNYSNASSGHVALAMKAAKNAFNVWSSTPVTIRAKLLQAAANSIRSHAKTISSLISSEMGKPMPEAEIEVAETADMISFMAEQAAPTLAGEICPVDVSLFPGKFNFVCPRPLGVVAIIKPWNYPLEMPAWAIAGALLAGNTVILKPSEHSPLVAEALVECFIEADLPSGTIGLLTGGPDVGEALALSHPDCVSFTGSLETGMKLSRLLAGRPVKLLLELGGKDPFIVCEDADLELAARGATWGAFTNCGQVCTSAERIIVVRSISDEFIRLFLQHARSLRLGDPSDREVDIGPLVSKKQLEKVRNQVDSAVADGAKVLCGGKQPELSKLRKGFYYEPTILTDVKSTMTVWTEETFGPVAPVMIVDDLNDAIAIANDGNYDLGASIWTRSLSNAFSLSASVRAGNIWVNDVNVAFPSSPWGGFLRSGSGKELSRMALLEYSAHSHISVDYNSDTTRAWWFPYGTSNDA